METEYDRFKPKANAEWEERLRQGEGRPVRLTYEYSSDGHGCGLIVPVGTEGTAVFSFRGTRPEVDYYRVKVDHPYIGPCWISMRKDRFEFTNKGT